MKLITLAILLALSIRAWSADITTESAFTEAIKAALTTKSAEKLNAIIYTSGMSEADKARAAKAQERILDGREIEGITLAELPKDFVSTFIVQGMKYEPTAQPSGLVKIDFKKTGSAVNSMSMPYAIIKGAYHLLTTKSTDLKWTGPADVSIGFMVMGKGQDKVSVRGKFNASGVDMERSFKGSSSTIFGQHFSEITVTSDDPETDVTLRVLENRNEIFKSEPLKGKGVITYKKKS